IAGPGVRDPACRADAGRHPHPAPTGSSLPATSGTTARLVGLAAAVALGPVTASPPPLAAGSARQVTSAVTPAPPGPVAEGRADHWGANYPPSGGRGHPTLDAVTARAPDPCTPGPG